jgi:hypothetical protein
MNKRNEDLSNTEAVAVVGLGLFMHAPARPRAALISARNWPRGRAHKVTHDLSEAEPHVACRNAANSAL